MVRSSKKFDRSLRGYPRTNAMQVVRNATGVHRGVPSKTHLLHVLRRRTPRKCLIRPKFLPICFRLGKEARMKSKKLPSHYVPLQLRASRTMTANLSNVLTCCRNVLASNIAWPLASLWKRTLLTTLTRVERLLSKSEAMKTQMMLSIMVNKLPKPMTSTNRELCNLKTNSTTTRRPRCPKDASPAFKWTSLMSGRALLTFPMTSSPTTSPSNWATAQISCQCSASHRRWTTAFLNNLKLLINIFTSNLFLE